MVTMKTKLMYSRLPTIICLFLWGCPSAVGRFVVSVIIGEPINRMPRAGPQTHIFKEGCKAVSPAITDRNSPCAVLDVVRCVWVMAAILHAFPCVIFDRFTQAVGFVRDRGSLPLEATTRLNLFTDMILPNNGFISAITATSPETMRALLSIKAGYQKHPESPAH